MLALRLFWGTNNANSWHPFYNEIGGSMYKRLGKKKTNDCFAE